MGVVSMVMGTSSRHKNIGLIPPRQRRNMNPHFLAGYSKH